MAQQLTPIKFNFFSMVFTPYKEDEGKLTPTAILKKIMTYIENEKKKGIGHVIDKHQNRKNEEARELFMSTSVIMLPKNRIRCSLALLRSGRAPKLKPHDDFKLIPLKDLGTAVEETHFFIDYSQDYAVICVEYNHNGPRISDIEYYLRSVAKTLQIARAVEVHMYMDRSFDKTLSDLKNVLNMDIKLQPKKLAQLDTQLVGKYFTGMNSIGHLLKPNYIKLEAMFQTPGKNVVSNELNKEANNMFVDLIKKFKEQPLNIDCFDNFVVKYENKHGQEEVFNLLSGKKEIIKEVDLNLVLKKREFYELIEPEFDQFINTLE